jgi:hypothetical protein
LLARKQRRRKQVNYLQALLDALTVGEEVDVDEGEEEDIAQEGQIHASKEVDDCDDDNDNEDEDDEEDDEEEDDDAEDPPVVVANALTVTATDASSVTVTAPVADTAAPLTVTATDASSVTVTAPVGDTAAPLTVTATHAAAVTVTAPANTPAVLNRAVVLKMKVSDLKAALSARGLDSNGQKTELVLRLVDALEL